MSSSSSSYRSTVTTLTEASMGQWDAKDQMDYTKATVSLKKAVKQQKQQQHTGGGGGGDEGKKMPRPDTIAYIVANHVESTAPLKYHQVGPNQVEVTPESQYGRVKALTVAMYHQCIEIQSLGHGSKIQDRLSMSVEERKQFDTTLTNSIVALKGYVETVSSEFYKFDYTQLLKALTRQFRMLWYQTKGEWFGTQDEFDQCLAAMKSEP
jgi:hypothetical protein